VHGSISSNEIVPYSDFDGLIILKDRYNQSKEIMRFLKQSNKIIHHFDPLQHHDWFIISKSELSSYDNTFLPIEVLSNSKLIYPDINLKLKITLKENLDYTSPFHKLVNSLRYKTNIKNYPRNSYQLKSYISEILLLPCIYLQAKHEKGISKKESFPLAASDFKNSEWVVIDIASQIRKNWKFDINIFQRKMAKSNYKIIKTLYKKLLAPKIDMQIKNLIPQNFNFLIENLIKKMCENLK
tara:strand:+ start:134 stop:853 length:720 start_codon:yes stop_codon:yes gene_type:complete